MSPTQYHDKAKLQVFITDKFFAWWNLHRHVPYICKHCKKSFGRSSVCKRHERTHTGEKPYSCKHCNKCFSQLENCKRHERTHTGEKPYTCKLCNKSFSTSSICKQHERTHTGVKPYTCKHCEKCFKVPLTPKFFLSCQKSPFCPDYIGEKIIVVRFFLDFL